LLLASSSLTLFVVIVAPIDGLDGNVNDDNGVTDDRRDDGNTSWVVGAVRWNGGDDTPFTNDDAAEAAVVDRDDNDDRGERVRSRSLVVTGLVAVRNAIDDDDEHDKVSDGNNANIARDNEAGVDDDDGMIDDKDVDMDNDVGVASVDTMLGSVTPSSVTLAIERPVNIFDILMLPIHHQQHAITIIVLACGMIWHRR
jgi:hypothetical protein